MSNETDMETAGEKMLFSLMEHEADVKYFLDRPQDDFKAEAPGMMITSGMFVAADAKKKEHYTLWFGQIAHWNFTSLEKAKEKAMEIVSRCKVKISVRVEGAEP